MRIEIIGSNLASQTLTSFLNKLGFPVVKLAPTFTVYLEESGNDFLIDGVDSDLERRVLYHMEDLGAERFILQRKGGIRSEREIKITYPAGKDELVARAVARAVQESRPSFWSRKLFLLGFLILAGTRVEAQQFVYGRAWDTVNLAAADPGDSTNQAIRVNCIAGCGAGSGATGLQVRSVGNVWTDVGYSGGNLTVPISGSISNTSFAATQSGTWNVGTLTSITNPVAVTGTFWQTTQPVSWSAQTVTVTQGTGTNLHTVLDSGTLTSITNTVSSNIAQIGANTVATDIGDRNNATLRVNQAGIPNIVTGQISCANTATLISASRAGRQGIMITNLGTVDVYVGTSGVTTANGDLLLGLKGANASYSISAAVYCIVASGTQSISYAEVY